MGKKLKHVLNVSKKLYYNQYFCNDVNNIKAMWRGIEQIINTYGRKMSFPSILEVNGNRLLDTKSTANAFNEYFTCAGPMLANSIQPGNRSFKDFMPHSP